MKITLGFKREMKHILDKEPTDSWVFEQVSNRDFN